MPSATENYLHDVLPELLEQARKARSEAGKGSGTDPFAAGRAMAYYEVLDYLVSQLDVFGIPRASVRIDPTFNVDRELA